MSYLELKNVSKSFGEGAHATHVLKNISLSVREGEFLVILGFSGSGKTTLINLIAGLERPDRGEVIFKDDAGEHFVRPTPNQINDLLKKMDA